MNLNWLAELPLSEQAAAERRTWSPEEFQSVQRTVEHVAMVRTVMGLPERPVVAITEDVIALLRDVWTTGLPDDRDPLDYVVMRLFGEPQA